MLIICPTWVYLFQTPECRPPSLWNDVSSLGDDVDWSAVCHNGHLYTQIEGPDLRTLFGGVCPPQTLGARRLATWSSVLLWLCWTAICYNGCLVGRHVEPPGWLLALPPLHSSDGAPMSMVGQPLYGTIFRGVACSTPSSCRTSTAAILFWSLGLPRQCAVVTSVSPL